MKLNKLKQFDKATDELAKFFVKKYFGNDCLENYYWVGSQDEDKEVLAINDYFFNLTDIVSYLRYDYTEDEVLEYYDYALDRITKDEVCINIKNWKK